jgi:hypothetical protein
MPSPHPDHLKHQFARWVASGGTVTSWCRESRVPVPTAYRWYRADWFRRLVLTYRRPLVDRAIGAMVRSLSEAVDSFDHLIERGATDAVKLAAARTLIDSMLGVGRRAATKTEARRLVPSGLDR